MCEAPICHCHCKMPTPVLKLEVGKTYQSKSGSVWKILANNLKDSKGSYLGHGVDLSSMQITNSYMPYKEDGSTYVVSGEYHLISEYKEPEYWYINIYPNSLCSIWRNNKQEAEEAASGTNPIRIRINKETKAVEKLS